MKIKFKKILKISLLYVLAPIVLVAAGAAGASLYIVNFAKGAYALMHDLYDWDRINDPDYYSFDAPIFIFQGEHDWQTPTTLVKPWFAKIEAPYKEYIAFSNSAHIVVIEEPAKYLHSLISRVRPFAVEEQAEDRADLE
jgi:pimeloyl-ACP methyl ester carboxylesterase